MSRTPFGWLAPWMLAPVAAGTVRTGSLTTHAGGVLASSTRAAKPLVVELLAPAGSPGPHHQVVRLEL